MDRPRDSQKATTRPSKPSTSDPKTLYLIIYNTISTLLWSTILARVLLTASSHGFSSVYPTTGSFVKYTQTLAGLEILHSLLGIVRAPLFTTFMQVASRFLLVWGIVDQFPQLATDGLHGGSVAYCCMLVAWSVTEVIRYAFFALSLARGAEGVPGVVKWARYNTFFVLYPLGIGSECWLVWLAAGGPARQRGVGGVRVSWGLYAVLGVYVPGKLSPGGDYGNIRRGATLMY
jgi:very-long-chain (3R)-3-hydroxyacyl-CoA dehydratase